MFTWLIFFIFIFSLIMKMYRGNSKKLKYPKLQNFTSVFNKPTICFCKIIFFFDPFTLEFYFKPHLNFTPVILVIIYK